MFDSDAEASSSDGGASDSDDDDDDMRGGDSDDDRRRGKAAGRKGNEKTRGTGSSKKPDKLVRLQSKQAVDVLHAWTWAFMALPLVARAAFACLLVWGAGAACPSLRVGSAHPPPPPPPFVRVLMLQAMLRCGSAGMS